MPTPKVAIQVPTPLMGWIEAIAAAGGRAWLVGGPVRDALRGRPVLDWDLAVDLEPGALLAGLRRSDGRCSQTDRERQLGAVQVSGPSAPGDRESSGGSGSAVTATFTSFREETGVTDHRHPERVAFGVGIAQDAARRDFTANALYADPQTGEVLDPTGAGLKDLEAGVLRVIGDPGLRFEEDALRLLRAWRFAHTQDLTPTPELLNALGRWAHLAKGLSPARLYQELTRTLACRRRGAALTALVRWGLAEHILPEVVPMDGVPQPPEFHPEGDVLTHVALVLDHIDPVDPVQVWSAVLHDVGKPATFERAADRIRFSGHDTLSADMGDVVLKRLQAPKKVRELVVAICRDHIRIASLPAMRVAKRERWLRDPDFSAHLAFHKADCLGSHGDLSIHAQATRWLRELPPLPPPPLVQGRDLLELGVPAGPVVGELLQQLESELETDGVEDRSTALQRARALVQSRFKA